MRNLIKGNVNDSSESQIGYKKKKKEYKEGDIWTENQKTWTIKNGIKQTISKLDKVKKEIFMPLSCPECNKVMKHHLDDKMYRLHNQCFDCQVKFESKLRAEGKYEQWEEKKVLNNQLSYVKDQIESIVDWKEEASKPFESMDSVGIKDIELQKEKWTQNTQQVEKMAKEALEELNKLKEDVEEKLNSLEV